MRLKGKLLDFLFLDYERCFVSYGCSFRSGHGLGEGVSYGDGSGDGSGCGNGQGYGFCFRDGDGGSWSRSVGRDFRRPTARDWLKAGAEILS